MKTRLSDKAYAETEQARHDFEVKFVSQQSGEWIKKFLEKVQEKRGFDAYQKLRDDVRKLWRK